MRKASKGTENVECPRCGRPLKLRPHPQQAGRVKGYCPCNRAGPVYEGPAAVEAPPPAEAAVDEEPQEE
jgi:hypothetical protein